MKRGRGAERRCLLGWRGGGTKGREKWPQRASGGRGRGKGTGAEGLYSRGDR